MKFPPPMDQQSEIRADSVLPTNVPLRYERLAGSGFAFVGLDQIRAHGKVRRLNQDEMAAVQPLVDRITAMKALSHEALEGALTALREQMPALLADARNKVPGIAPIWRQIAAAALLDFVGAVPPKQ